MTKQDVDYSHPEVSAWVSASAGTGKTRALTNRVLRLLLAGNEPSKILCLTFTKSAAAEMSNRINQELSSWVILSDEQLTKQLLDLTGIIPTTDTLLKARKLFLSILDSSTGMRIQTIHSFCQALLQKFPVEAGINSGFNIIDDTESSLLLQEAKLELLASNSISNTIKFVSWNLYEQNINELIEEIIINRAKLTSILSSYQSTEAVISECYHKFGLKAGLEEVELLAEFYHTTDFKVMRNWGSILADGGATESKLASKLLEILSYAPEQSQRFFLDYQNIFLTKEHTPRKILSKSTTAKHPYLLEIANQEQSRVLEFLAQYNALHIIIRTKHLFCLSEALLTKYTKQKEQKGVLDYTDLINITSHLLHKNLTSQWILYKLDEGIDHILVDEAQDTSKEQWQIIEALTNEFFAGDSGKDHPRTLFVVGDEKQSIYSFQGADPLTFHYMQHHFKTKSSHNDNNFQPVYLTKSFRSCHAILSLVDAVFRVPELKEAISLSAGNISHLTHRTTACGIVEVWPLLTVEKEAEHEPWALPLVRQIKHNPAALMAELIAENIQAWISGKRMLHSKQRPVVAGDILILVQRRNDFTEMLVRELKKRSIASSGIDRMVMTDNLAVMDLIALGNFLLLPEDDLNLACLLKSPLVGISEEELFQLCVNRAHQSLWDHLQTQESSALTYLNNITTQCSGLSPSALYLYVLEVQQGRQKFHSRLGEEIDDPIDEFLNLALKYEANHIPSLQGFLHWLDNSDIEVKRDLSQSKEQVRIMTVHSAKGLQAPIVILPDTVATPPSKQMLLWDENLVFWPGKSENYNPYCQKLKEARLKSQNNEYLRLLYVALTRAEDQLIICGYHAKKKPQDQCWYNIIQQTMAKHGLAKDFDRPDRFNEYMQHQQMLVLEDPLPFSSECAILQTKKSELQIPPMPQFIFKPAPQEPVPPLPLIASSRVLATAPRESPLKSSKPIIRGKLVHKLLEMLPAIRHNKPKAIQEFLAQHAQMLTPADKQQIEHNCLAIVSHVDFAQIFGPNSRAEVPITGVINNQYIISGQIDRLTILEHEVIVVDYKTTKNPPNTIAEVPTIYLRQMAAYRVLLKEIYPNKEISCALIWTENPSLMPLSNQLLDQQELCDIVQG